MKKKSFSVAPKTPKLACHNDFFKKKVGFFQGGGGGPICLRQANFGVFGATEKLFFSNRSEFRQEFNGSIRKIFRPQLEAVEAVFRNFLGG